MPKGGFLVRLEGSTTFMLNKGFRTAEELTNFLETFPDRNKGRISILKTDDLAGAMGEIKRKGIILSALHPERLGTKILDSIPGSSFISKKVELIGKIGLAAAGVVGASGSAFAATGDFNRAARAGYNEGKSELSSTLNPENSFGRAWHNLKGGVAERNIARAGASLPIAIEGVGRVMGLGTLAEWGERDRVMPAATEILKDRGARALVNEVMRTQENPRYIIRAALENKMLPQKLDVPQANGQIVQTSTTTALHNNNAYNMYMDNLEGAINSTSGPQKRVWENQRDLVQGYRQALAASGGMDMPKRVHGLNEFYRIDQQQKNLLNSSEYFPDKINLDGRPVDTHIALRNPGRFNVFRQYYESHNSGGQFNDELRTLDRFAQLERQRDTMIDRAEARGELNPQTADLLQKGTNATSIRTGFTFTP